MVHLISQLRKAAEDGFGSKFAVPASRRECPLFSKAAVAAARRMDSATCDGAAGFGLLRLDPSIVR
jgi:hypothetical protein